jgi:hypothetical protein
MAVQRFLSDHGDEMISNLKVCRAPISSMLDKAMDLISFGGYSKGKKEDNIDKFVHTSLVVTTDKGIYRIEKNQLVKCFPYKQEPNEEYIGVPMQAKSINQFLQDGISGFDSPADFWANYSALNHNCQWWIIHCLQGNGVLTPAIQSFVVQSLEGVLRNSGKGTETTANTLTDLGAGLDNFVQDLSGGLLSFRKGGRIRRRIDF